MIATFFRDGRRWGWGTAWWNLRFNVGFALLPGDDKSASCPEGERGETTGRFS